MSVDGTAAAQTLLARATCEPGLCLYYVWQAYKAHGASTARSAGTAFLAWQRSEGQHPGDRNPPAGVPVYWGPKPSSNAGDVVISIGGGRVVATDWPRYGVIGVCTIDERERQIGRPYLGWTEQIFDQPISFGTTAGDGATPFEEEDMFTDDDRALLRSAVTLAESAKAGIWKGGSEVIDGIAQTFKYGALPISAHTQTLVAAQAGRLAAIEEVVQQLAAGAGTVLDMAAISAAAERGTAKALAGLVLTAQLGDATPERTI